MTARVQPEVVGERVEELRARIAAAGGGRDVTVVAVTKGFGPEAAAAAFAAGVADCGENHAQALLAKAPLVADAVRWHFLGPVQRNKVNALVPVVARWHAIDRDTVGRSIVARGGPAPALVQVNLTGDPARPGCAWDDAAALGGAVSSGRPGRRRADGGGATSPRRGPSGLSPAGPIGGDRGTRAPLHGDERRLRDRRRRGRNPRPYRHRIVRCAPRTRSGATIGSLTGGEHGRIEADDELSRARRR